MLLKFKNPVFNNGVNVTVRRGIRWSLTDEPELGFPVVNTNDPIKDDGQDKIIGFAGIIDRKVIRFCDIKETMICDEHDPKCKTYLGLFEVMKQVYNDFDEDEIVTVLKFNFT